MYFSEGIWGVRKKVMDWLGDFISRYDATAQPLISWEIAFFANGGGAAFHNLAYWIYGVW